MGKPIEIREDAISQTKLKEFLNTYGKREGPYLEFKERVSPIKLKDVKNFINTMFKQVFCIKILREIYGMHNAKGGFVVVGVSNAGGILGITETEAKELLAYLNSKLSNKAKTTSIEEIIVKIEGINLNDASGRKVLKIEVKKINKPEKPALLEGVLYTRIGSENKLLTDLESLNTSEAQFYSFYLKGIEKYLKLLGSNEAENQGIDTNTYIDGLKIFIAKLNIPKINKENLLKELQNVRAFIVRRSKAVDKFSDGVGIAIDDKDEAIDNKNKAIESFIKSCKRLEGQNVY